MVNGFFLGFSRLRRHAVVEDDVERREFLVCDDIWDCGCEDQQYDCEQELVEVEWEPRDSPFCSGVAGTVFGWPQEDCGHDFGGRFSLPEVEGDQDRDGDCGD